jgi:aspartate carbamoyltransferase catalytic subunit
MKHLLSVDDLGPRAGIEAMLDLTDSFVEIGQRDIPKVPALRGKTVVSLFYEDSTRTRLSFETAAKRLGADTMTFSVSTSSVKKGESLLDTVQTIEAMGIDAIVVRHSAAGAPQTPVTAATSTPRRLCSTPTRCVGIADPRSTVAGSRSSATSGTREWRAAM